MSSALNPRPMWIGSKVKIKQESLLYLDEELKDKVGEVVSCVGDGRWLKFKEFTSTKWYNVIELEEVV